MDLPRRITQNDDKTSQIKTDLKNELQEVLRNRIKVTRRLRPLKREEKLNDEPVVVDDYDRRIQLRKKAIEEILTSEKSYLAQLEKLMNYFVLPLKDVSLIEISSHTQLFGQIELIYNINTELLSRLETDLNDVANAFLRLAPFFKIYSVFAFDYKNSMILLQHLTTKHIQFRNFLQKTESRPEVQQKLNSLLIAPIQRVPRYRLLLQQVLFYTSPSDRDYKLIQESIKQIESTINHINSVVEDQDNIQALLNIQNSLVNRIPHIVRPSRRLLKEGVLFKYSANGTMMKRHCILCSDIFMYCKIIKDRKSDTAVENSLDCCCIFPLKKCKIREIFAGKFKLTCMGEGIIMCSEDVQTGRGWIKALQEAIDMHVEYRKTIKKESSRRKPMRKKEMKKFDRLEMELMSPNEKKSHYDKVFYGLNASTTEIKDDNEHSCFYAASRRLLKRKHSETDDDVYVEPKQTETPHKSFFTVLKEKFTNFNSHPNVSAEKPQKTTILTLNKYEGETSYQCESQLSHHGIYKTEEHAAEREVEVVPRKRVKFDENNLVMSSSQFQFKNDNKPAHHKEKTESLLSRIIDFTANLF